MTVQVRHHDETPHDKTARDEAHGVKTAQRRTTVPQYIAECPNSVPVAASEHSNS